MRPHTAHHAAAGLANILSALCMQDFKGSDFELLNIYCIPTKPGYVRLIVRDFLGASGGVPLGLRIAGVFICCLRVVQ